MTPEQFALLLTTARVLRVFMRESMTAESSDLDALDEVLVPFEAVKGHAQSEATD